MAYTIDIANVRTDMFRRFASLNPHQLAGHLANLDFWLNEIRHSTDLIDGYRKRFDALKAAQVKEAEQRGTIEFTLDDDRFGGPASPPTPVSHVRLQAARQELMDAAYKFLLRCHKSGLLDENQLKDSLHYIGTSIDPADLAN